jgi:hypothetical protein
MILLMCFLTVSLPRLTLPRSATPWRTYCATFLADDTRTRTSKLSPTLTGVFPGTFRGSKICAVATPGVDPPPTGGGGVPPLPPVTPYRPDSPQCTSAKAHPVTTTRRVRRPIRALLANRSTCPRR